MFKYKTQEIQTLLRKYQEKMVILRSKENLLDEKDKLIKLFSDELTKIKGYKKATSDLAQNKLDYLIIGRTKTGRIIHIDLNDIYMGAFRSNTYFIKLYDLLCDEDATRYKELSKRKEIIENQLKEYDEKSKLY